MREKIDFGRVSNKVRKYPEELYKYYLTPFEKFVLTHPSYGHPVYNPNQKNEFNPRNNPLY